MDSIPGEMRWDLYGVRYESVIDESIDREFSSLFGTVDFVFVPVPTAAMVETAGDPGKIFFMESPRRNRERGSLSLSVGACYLLDMLSKEKSSWPMPFGIDTWERSLLRRAF